MDGIIKLNARQGCAIESAGWRIHKKVKQNELMTVLFLALMNPDHEVFVLFTSQVGFRNTTVLPIIDALLSYPNVHINYLNLTQYAEHTPLDKWMKTGELFRSM